MMGGEEHPAWYDALNIPVDDPKRGNIEHVLEAVDELTQIIKEEQDQYYYQRNELRPRIFLSGFSQGACISLIAGIISIFDLVQGDDDFLGIKAKGISCTPLAGVHVTGSVIIP